MKAPDKIYVCIPQRLNLSTFKEDSKYVGMAYNDKGNLKSPQIEEYIRKDIVDETIKTAEDHAYFAGRKKLRETLLEWLEALKVQAFEIREDDGGDVFYGSRIELLEELISKIESL